MKFLISDSEKMFFLLKNSNSVYWKKIQEKNSLSLFQKASEKIPAYKKFLKKYKINPKSIKSWNDFKRVPVISKENYLRNNLLNELCWDGKIINPNIFTSTSGSTGKPFFFLRNEEIDWRCSIFMEDFIRAGNEKKMPSTLCIICFGMGVWIGGLITFKALEQLAKRNNYPISIITPGINKKEIITILKELSPHYEQIIFAGYPPFIKDVIDEAVGQKISFKNKKVKIKFAAEAISEGLRDYISKRTDMSNIYKDTINVYGSADIGAMAVENAVCILIKRLINGNQQLFQEIFSPINRIPTLAQYNPYFVNFEAVNGSLYLTSDNTLPLIRYAIGDKGGTMNFDEMVSKLRSYGIDLISEVKKLGLLKYIYKLPFVYVYERDDLSTSFYGLWIYPEWIRGALLDLRIQQYVTGKFTMISKFDANQNQYMELNLELKKDKITTKHAEGFILKRVLKSLQSHSSEYTEILTHLGKKAYPVIKFWPYENLNYFKPGIKQKWVTKIE